MKKFQLLFFIVTSAIFCQAQSNFGSSNIQSEILGDQSYFLPNAFVSLENPAALSTIENLSFGVSARNNWLISDLNSFYFAAAIPSKAGNFGFGVINTGFEGFSQSKLGVAYGRKIIENLNIGLNLNYFLLNAATNGNLNLLNFDLGLQAKVNDNLALGATLYSPIPHEFGEIIAQTFAGKISIGFAYKFSDKVILASNAEKILDRDFSVKGGINYQLAEPLNLLLGFNSNPSTFGVALNFSLAKSKIGLSNSYNSTLGNSPMFSYFFENSK